ncbi:low molecular weight protein-tyrosine-phosphatase [Streptomyces sp. RFCAC02]|uniref:low molecular weight protein-tyrosine-phosphatase n=1 Tax=Streptomyces sp. RFCAC02 TaxID=2499143 RepID=UPI0010204F5D|nr:low molecular weight protein-tyrosine-phosphatase [Streptomyces sp. RFCAC02]
MTDTPPGRICMVCSGNICRSPMAEVVLRTRLGEAGAADRYAVDSAGTGDWHVGEHADPRATAALLDAGYDTAPEVHVARAFEADWFDRYGVVIALDRGHERALRALARTPEERAKVRLLRSFEPAGPGRGAGLDVPDPYYGGAEDFVTSLRIIEGAVPGLVAWLAEPDGER